jgi:hypothetical protein
MRCRTTSDQNDRNSIRYVYNHKIHRNFNEFSIFNDQIFPTAEFYSFVYFSLLSPQNFPPNFVIFFWLRLTPLPVIPPKPQVTYYHEDVLLLVNMEYEKFNSTELLFQLSDLLKVPLSSLRIGKTLIRYEISLKTR